MSSISMIKSCIIFCEMTTVIIGVNKTRNYLLFQSISTKIPVMDCIKLIEFGVQVFHKTKLRVIEGLIM
jgi:hypothetical protein